MKRINASCFILTTAFIAIANIQAEDKKEHAHAKTHAELAPNGAFCRSRPTKDNKTFGQILFVERNGVLHVTGRVRNLTKGEHGFHVHEFGGEGGVSGVAVLAESHISVHTWPELDYAAFDVFMCGTCNPEKAVETLCARLNPDRFTVDERKRGIIE